MKLFTKPFLAIIIILFFGVTTTLSSNAQTTRSFTVQSTVYSGSGNVTVNLVVTNFSQIEDFQFSIDWDNTKLTYVSYSIPTSAIKSDGFNASCINAHNTGVGLQWYDANLSGVTVPDNTTILSVTFSPVGTLTSSVPITIGSSPVSKIAADTTDGNFSAPGQVPTTFNNGFVVVNNNWTGTTSTDWNTASNWSSGTVPVSTDYVVIPAVSNLPIISSLTTASCTNITINSSASLTVDGILQIGGTISNSGTFTASSGTITLNGSSAQTIPASTFSSNTIQNLIINNSSGVTLGGILTVTGTITPTSGTLTTGGNLVLASSSGNNASIAQGSGSYVSGNVTVRRYIGSSAQWRTIGFPFTQATTISESTLAAFYSSGYKAYTYSEGSDDQSHYGNSGTTNAGWTQFTTGTTSAKNGILLSGGTISSTINFTGPINTGTQTIALTKAKSGWNFIANPFASAINWTTINTANSSLVNNAIYRYDPNTTAYATYVSGSSTGNQGNVIENGAGFFVQAKSAGNLSIAESDKTTGAPLASLMGVQPINDNKSIIKLSLSKQGDQYADEVVLRWGVDPATDNFDGDYDAYDMGRAVGPDISVIGTDKTVYSIFHGSELKNNSVENRTIQLGIGNMEEGTYQIAIQLLSAIANSNKAYLFDSYTNQYTLIDGNTNSYTFIATSDPRSQSSTRFSVVMNAKLIIDNNNTNYNVTLLNNPSTGNLFTLYSKNNYKQLQWQIIDGSGRFLQAGLLSNVLKGSTHQINAGNTTSGNYFIKLTGDSNALPVLKAIKN